jgi:hypothetical protein
VIGVIADPEQAGIEADAVITGFGLTVTTCVVVVKQSPKAAFSVNVVVCGELEVLVNVPVIGDPSPLRAIPLRLVLTVLVQLYRVPSTLFEFEIMISLIDKPEQTLCDG